MCCPIFVEQIPQELRWRKAVLSESWLERIEKGDDALPTGQHISDPKPQERKFADLCVEQFWAAFIDQRQKNLFHLQNCSARVAAHDSILVVYSVARENNSPSLCWILTENSTYCFSRLASTVVEGKRKKRLVYALCNLYLIIFIRNINNKWKFAGTICDRKATVTRYPSQSTQTFPRLTTNNIKSSEIVQVFDKRIRKRNSSFLTQIRIQTKMADLSR